MLKLLKVFCSSFALAAGCLIPVSASAQISVHGSTTAYQETGGDWLTMGANDIDGSGGLGTDGYLFFGIFDGGITTGVMYDEGTVEGSSASRPSYLEFDNRGADTSEGRPIVDENSAWGLFDNPVLVGTDDEGEDTHTGLIVGGSGPQGSFQELVVFSIAGLAADETVRVGVFAGSESTGQFDPIAIRLSDRNNSSISQTVGSTINPANFLDANPGGVQAGWVFFDITADGDYAVSGAVRVNNQLFGAFSGINGITFDSAIGTPFLLGDCNIDGVVDFSDISSFIAFLASKDFLAQADINQDNFIDFDDIGPFITLLSNN